MKRLATILFLVTFSVSYGQWFGQKTIKDNGNIINKERRVGNYSSVKLKGFIDVILLKGEVGKVRIEASDNIEPYILTTVKGGEITIELQEGYNYNFKHKVNVYVPVNERLEQISLSGSGDISMKEQIKVENLKCTLSGSGDISVNFDATRLDLSLSGSGDLTVRGNCPEINIKMVGSGDITTDSIRAERVTVQLSGSGDVDVYASKSIKAKVSGSGDISVKGKPELQDTQVIGSGEIHFK
ncbi:MAG: head GIN domain-containing protein [Capnocytophaga felis]|nr:head GIN domain-containing protein [Capnocytophaga felis]